MIEFDPAYCDVILRRFEHITGRQTILAVTGMSFEEVIRTCSPGSVKPVVDAGPIRNLVNTARNEIGGCPLHARDGGPAQAAEGVA